MNTKKPSPMVPGILFRGKTIWISELVSIFSVSALSVLLLGLSFKIVTNELNTHHLKSSISKVRSETIILSEFKAQLSEKTAIARLLCTIAGKKLPGHVILDLSEIVYDNSTQFGYDPLLLLAVMKVESVFEPQALGRFKDGVESGAMGLMQLKYETAQEVAAQLNMKDLKREDLFRPDINIVLGTAYLTRMISRFKSFKLGILAYNQGPAAINRQLATKQPLSVQYYRKVLDAYYELRKQASQNEIPENRGTTCD